MLMQDIKSLNFEPLRSTSPELANMGGHAEHYAYSDPESSLVKLRNFGERVVDHVYRQLRIPKPIQAKSVDLLNNASFAMAVNKDVLDKLHLLRKFGNPAAHGESVPVQNALRAVHEAWQLARWLHVTYVGGKASDFAPYQEPRVEGIDSKADLKREKKRLAEDNAIKEERLKAALLELEALRAAETTQWAAINKESKVIPEAELIKLAEKSEAIANQLKFSEDRTREFLIDRDLAQAGWQVPTKDKKSENVGIEVEVKHQATNTGIGYIDYVLWDDNGLPLAVVEAKRTTKDARIGQAQAKDYADGLEKIHGQRPMIFFTNGHDIWVWDDAMGYPPRKVYGFYSKDSLQYRVSFQRQQRQDLLKVQPDPNIAGRLYQIETLTRVKERFAAKHRKSLIVQATGTGKTRVAIALSKILIEAKWAKRILFLCDRKELRKQGKKVFNDFLHEPIYVFGDSTNTTSKFDSRIYIGIYQGLINDYEKFDVGFFDLIIADESHRSIYNQYGDIFRYFDALQVGLTATPVEMVSRSTCDLFGCDYKTPTANYTLEDAVAQRNLVPFKVVTHTTKFLREGIKGKDLTDEQYAELEAQGIDPNTLDFEGKEIDDAIFNKDTNRVILRNLMANGIRDADGQLPGKTIIFARNINHARLLQTIFDEEWPQFGGKFCAVIHSEELRAEQLIDDFKGEDNCKNDQLRIAISVDMLDTGIDVPAIVNLVFAKPVKSKVKFWQMIGRGTRLCENLFGPGIHKSEFLIFDHWGNFEYHEMHPEEAEVKTPKSVIQRRYEARIKLARHALKTHNVDVFDTLCKQLLDDAATLTDTTIDVRDNWQAVQQARDQKVMHDFAPATALMLEETIAPLMNTVDTRGQGDALRWDILLLNAQHSNMARPQDVNPFKESILELLGRLPPNLHLVRAKANDLKAIEDQAFWNDLSFAALEGKRQALRDIVHLADKTYLTPGGEPKIFDIKEDVDEFEVDHRKTKIKSVDARIYQKTVQEALTPLFNTNPVLIKIREGMPVTESELDQLNSMLHTQHPNLDLNILKEFYSDTAAPLAHILRGIIGMDDQAVENRFTTFAQKYVLSSVQLRFLSMLKDQISAQGGLKLNALFEMPFTQIHTEGIGGVFTRDDQFTELANIIRSFGEPPTITPK